MTLSRSRCIGPSLSFFLLRPFSSCTSSSGSLELFWKDKSFGRICGIATAEWIVLGNNKECKKMSLSRRVVVKDDGVRVGGINEGGGVAVLGSWNLVGAWTKAFAMEPPTTISMVHALSEAVGTFSFGMKIAVGMYAVLGL